MYNIVFFFSTSFFALNFLYFYFNCFNYFNYIIKLIVLCSKKFFIAKYILRIYAIIIYIYTFHKNTYIKYIITCILDNTILILKHEREKKYIYVKLTIINRVKNRNLYYYRILLLYY